MIRDQLTYENVQNALALVAAWGFGLWTGINYVGRVAPTEYTFEKPAWVGQAEWAAWASLAVIALAVAGWIVLDYRYRQASVAVNEELEEIDIEPEDIIETEDGFKVDSEAIDGDVDP
jgi:hypothetical protein